MKLLFPYSNKFIFKVARRLKKKNYKIFFYGYKPNNFVKSIYDLKKILNNYNNLEINNDLKIKSKNYSLFQKLFVVTSRRIFFDKKINLNILFWKLTSINYDEIKKRKIKHVLFYQTPHFPFEISLYYACKLLKINTYIMYKTSFDNYYIIKKDWFSSQKYKSLQSKRNIKLIDFKKSKTIKRIKYKKNNDVYGFFFIKFFLFLLKQIIKILVYKKNPDKDGYFFLNDDKKFLEIQLKIKLYLKIIFNKFLYKYKYIKDINYHQLNYVYYPIHIEPERTVCPEGGIKFSDQIKLIELLSRSLPKNTKIIVKEHPNQFILRSAQIQSLFYKKKEFYERLNKIKKVLIVDTNYDSIDLIKNSKCICTISGTAGWEALNLNKKVIIFSNTWYEDHKNCLLVKDENKLTASKIKNFIIKKKSHNKKKMIEFKKFIKPYLFEGISIDPSDTKKQNMIRNFTEELNLLFKKYQ